MCSASERILEETFTSGNTEAAVFFVGAKPEEI